METEITIEVDAEEPHPHAELIERARSLPAAPDRDAVLSNLLAGAYQRALDAEEDVQDIEDRAERRRKASGDAK